MISIENNEFSVIGTYINNNKPKNAVVRTIL